MLVSGREDEFTPGSSSAAAPSPPGPWTYAGAAAALPSPGPSRVIRECYPPTSSGEVVKIPTNCGGVSTWVCETPTISRSVEGCSDSIAEYRVVQRYLTKCNRMDPTIVWYYYAPPKERLTKVGIRGLPRDTLPDNIVADFQRMGFVATYARAIPLRRFRPGTIFEWRAPASL